MREGGISDAGETGGTIISDRKREEGNSCEFFRKNSESKVLQNPGKEIPPRNWIIFGNFEIRSCDNLVNLISIKYSLDSREIPLRDVILGHLINP